MKISLITSALLVVLLVPTCLQAQSAMPQMKTVEPGAGKAGDILTVTGENLEKSNVAKVYLTDGKNDYEVGVTDQAATAIKFKVPTSAKPGRLALMILTRGKDPKLIEQPVKVTIEQ